MSLTKKQTLRRSNSKRKIERQRSKDKKQPLSVKRFRI